MQPARDFEEIYFLASPGPEGFDSFERDIDHPSRLKAYRSCREALEADAEGEPLFPADYFGRTPYRLTSVSETEASSPLAEVGLRVDQAEWEPDSRFFRFELWEPITIRQAMDLCDRRHDPTVVGERVVRRLRVDPVRDHRRPREHASSPSELYVLIERSTQFGPGYVFTGGERLRGAFRSRSPATAKARQLSARWAEPDPEADFGPSINRAEGTAGPYVVREVSIHDGASAQPTLWPSRPIDARSTTGSEALPARDDALSPAPP